MTLDREWIRPAAVAGTWYPDDPEDLSRMIQGYLDSVRPVDGEPDALIVPHAGYRYSGSVAAHAFKQLESSSVDTAVVIASDHQAPRSRPISVWAKGGFETPLGTVPVNEELASALVEYDPRIRFDPETHAGEHPIEIELPFLKQVRPECRIVPVMIGTTDPDVARLLAEALIELLPDKGVVVIASSDLSHYAAYDAAIEVDAATLGAVELRRPEALRETIRKSMGRGIPNLATCACGELPIEVAMTVAAAKKVESVNLLKYENSGDVDPRDRARVVGYGALMLWHYEPPEVTDDQAASLIALAREAVGAAVRGGQAPDDPVAGLERLSAVFVTLRFGGELRGCIGQVRADTPLYQAVRDKAVAAATADPRFRALTENELDELNYEISILSPIARVASTDEIELGKHGVSVQRGGHRSVLLPKVASGRNWSRKQLLENLLVKAELPPEGWKDPEGIYRFTTVEIES